jgi:hypothetical protein
MVLTYDAYNETLESEREDTEVQVLKEKFEFDIKIMRQEIKEEMKIQSTNRG